jgi:hypothetical protein
MARGTESSASTGSKIIVAGLFIQILFFGAFLVVAAHFHMKIRHREAASPVPWRKHMLTLYGVSLLILVRSIFRTIEYIQGNDGYLLRNEVWLYIFDATLMAGVMIWLNIVHPSNITVFLRGKGMRGDLGSVPLTECQS